MSRTSAMQIELMVSFMEQHGDLSRPIDGPNGRITSLRKWREIVSLLNEDVNGSCKTEEKWRRTWTDLKNNTKKKAAKINKATSGTGGGPATNLVLTPMEQRILDIINPQAATGIQNIIEIGIVQSQDSVAVAQPVEEPVIVEVDVAEPVTIEVAEVPSNSEINALESTNMPSINIDQPSTSQMNQNVPPLGQRNSKRRRQEAPHQAPKRHMSQPDLARQAFVDSDTAWREYQKKKDDQAYELEKERIRLRQIELEQQAKWQELFTVFLDIIKNLTKKLPE